MKATQKRPEVAMVTPTTGSTTAPHSGWRQLVPVTVILVACTSSVTAADMQYRKVNRFTAATRGCQGITLLQTQEEALHF